MALRVGHLLRIGTYLTMAMLSMWRANPRTRVVMGMAQASVRGEGPGSGDEELLTRLRDLISEAIDYYEQNEFPAASEPRSQQMARAGDRHSLSAGLAVLARSSTAAEQGRISQIEAHPRQPVPWVTRPCRGPNAATPLGTS